jgi:hypothetical protein
MNKYRTEDEALSWVRSWQHADLWQSHVGGWSTCWCSTSKPVEWSPCRIISNCCHPPYSGQMLFQLTFDIRTDKRAPLFKLQNTLLHSLQPDLRQYWASQAYVCSIGQTVQNYCSYVFPAIGCSSSVEFGWSTTQKKNPGKFDTIFRRNCSRVWKSASTDTLWVGMGDWTFNSKIASPSEYSSGNRRIVPHPRRRMHGWNN